MNQRLVVRFDGDQPFFVCNKNRFEKSHVFTRFPLDGTVIFRYDM